MTRTIRFRDLPASRWANGLGETVELWRTPTASAEPFDVRLSIATVGTDAPFSPLPGVDRALMALAPGGLTLDVDGHRTALDRYGSVAFRGESSVHAVGVTVPSQDLNLMVRRGLGSPELAVRPVAQSVALDALAVVALGGHVVGPDGDLAVGDAVVTTREDEPILLDGSGRVAVARCVSG